MKHVKLFEGFINEAKKTERGKYHPEVETFIGEDGDDRLRSAFGIHNIFGSSAEYEMEKYNKVKPADIKKAIKEVGQWIIIPKNASKLKKFLAMFKTNNAKNLEDIYTYVMLGKSQSQLERKYKVKGFIGQAEVLSQIAAEIKKMNLDPNKGTSTAKLGLKEVKMMEKDLQKMLAALEKFEDDTEDGDGQERVDEAYDSIEEATLLMRARIISELMDLEESVAITEAVKSAAARKFSKTLYKYSEQLEELAGEYEEVEDACYEAAELLESAAARLEYI